MKPCEVHIELPYVAEYRMGNDGEVEVTALMPSESSPVTHPISFDGLPRHEQRCIVSACRLHNAAVEAEAEMDRRISAAESLEFNRVVKWGGVR